MHWQALAAAGLACLSLFYWEHAIAGAGFSGSRGMVGSAGGRPGMSTSGFHSGSRPGIPGRFVPRQIAPRKRFDDKFFVPRRHGPRTIIISPFPLQRGFFFDQRIVEITPGGTTYYAYPTLRTAEPRFGGITEHEESGTDRPVISLILRYRNELELSQEQVRALEDLDDAYQRKTIRGDADIRIAELDLEKLLKADPVNLDLARMKLEEIEARKVEVRLARVGAIEQAKTLLSADQRAKLSTLIGWPR
jgi:hypothetical protein